VRRTTSRDISITAEPGDSLTGHALPGELNVRILLPPSEGKTAVQDAPPVDLDRLFLPELRQARSQVLAALTTLCERDVDEAAAVLKLGQRQRDDVAANTRLATAPAAAAETVYTGVLFESLRLRDLPPAARELAHHSVLIFSGLWGAVRVTDRIPAYRCPVGVTLPGLGGDRPTALATYWRHQWHHRLPAILDGEFVLDLRSGAYQAMWRPAGAHAAVRVLQERTVAGRTKRTVVSHFNKATKGRIAADLLTEAIDCDSPAGLVTALRDLKYTVEHDDTDPARIDVIVTEV
jgi:cytoplasmic iron level regulating protein YaaA (DUF328/UPF0246 family)